MNFDFNEIEKNEINELNEILKNLLETIDQNQTEPGQIKLDQIKKNLHAFISGLEKSSYFKLGFDEINDLNDITLMTFRKEVASRFLSFYLMTEMSIRFFGKILKTFFNNSKTKDDNTNKLLNLLYQGKLIGAVAVSEKSSDHKNEQFKTHGFYDKESVILNGEKNFVINGPIADFFAVAGNIENENAIFLVEKNKKGLELGKNKKIAGYKNVLASEIKFCDCKVAKSNVVKVKNLHELFHIWENEILVGASIGMMKSSFERAKDFAKTHKVSGKPLIAFQEIGFKLAEMFTLFQTSELMAYRACQIMKNKKEKEVLMDCAKIFCTEAVEKIASDALLILSKADDSLTNDTMQTYVGAKYNQTAATSTVKARIKIAESL